MAQSKSSTVVQSSYNALVSQNVVVVGTIDQTESIKRALQTLNFVKVMAVKRPQDIDSNAQFLVMVADFKNLPALQTLAGFLLAIPNFTGSKLIFATNPVVLSNEEILFGVELDVKRTFSGLQRDDELKEFIKSQAVETTKAGNFSFIESEVKKAIGRQDKTGMTSWLERLKGMDKSSEEVNRLIYLLYEATGDQKRMLFHLKKILVANPLNLWAANKLGVYYLAQSDPAEGITILKKLSKFHELNAERMLVLGNAYLNVGDVEHAEQVLEKGFEITGRKDERFVESLAKVEVVRGEPSKALSRLGRQFLSTPIMSFLNTRAVMATRNGHFDEGLRLYHQALIGCDPTEQLVQAKLLFNQGLAFVRNKQPNLAELAFERSLVLGGKQFDRAARPLSIVRGAAGKQQSEQSSKESTAAMAEYDFESAS